MSEFASQGPLYLFSTEHIPASPKPEPDALSAWHGPDNEKRYRKEPHPTLGPDDVQYRFNTLGYRSRECTPADGGQTLGVAVLGASEILGIGVPQDATVSAVFARLLGQHLERPVVDWNFGIGGTSPDYITRMLVSVLPVLRPTVVLMVFPHAARREHIDADGKVWLFNNGLASQRRLATRLLEPERHALVQASMSLASESNDAVNLYKNYLACAALCEQHGAMWLFSATRDSFLDEIAHLVDPAHRVQPGLGDLKISFGDRNLAVGRDMHHPGIGPHREMAALFLATLEACYADRLRLLEPATATDLVQLP
ncbi:MAG: hypothetical protein KAZ63_04000 [Vitreoscilla sp.]|nr:hypothetical protein [Vitreoscilla sp.]